MRLNKKQKLDDGSAAEVQLHCDESLADIFDEQKATPAETAEDTPKRKATSKLVLIDIDSMFGYYVNEDRESTSLYMNPQIINILKMLANDPNIVIANIVPHNRLRAENYVKNHGSNITSKINHEDYYVFMREQSYDKYFNKASTLILSNTQVDDDVWHFDFATLNEQYGVVDRSDVLVIASDPSVIQDAKKNQFCTLPIAAANQLAKTYPQLKAEIDAAKKEAKIEAFDSVEVKLDLDETLLLARLAITFQDTLLNEELLAFLTSLQNEYPNVEYSVLTARGFDGEEGAQDYHHVSNIAALFEAKLKLKEQQLRRDESCFTGRSPGRNMERRPAKIEVILAEARANPGKKRLVIFFDDNDDELSAAAAKVAELKKLGTTLILVKVREEGEYLHEELSTVQRFIQNFTAIRRTPSPNENVPANAAAALPHQGIFQLKPGMVITQGKVTIAQTMVCEF